MMFWHWLGIVFFGILTLGTSALTGYAVYRCLEVGGKFVAGLYP